MKRKNKIGCKEILLEQKPLDPKKSYFFNTFIKLSAFSDTYGNFRSSGSIVSGSGIATPL